MANFEIWDYVSTVPVLPDYRVILDIKPQNIIVEDGQKNQIVLLADDNSEEIISLNDTSVFYVNLQWDFLSESNAGTLFDWYHSEIKANGMARSFKWRNWAEKDDRHIYTVRFASPLPRSIYAGIRYSISEIKLKILGRAP